MPINLPAVPPQLIGWEAALFPQRPHRKPPGDPEMLRLIAYDIACPKRLHRVACACEDYGVRVQKSLFECWLEEPEFHRLWSRLQKLILPSEDKVVAYTLDAADARRRQTGGAAMRCTEKTVCYLF